MLISHNFINSLVFLIGFSKSGTPWNIVEYSGRCWMPMICSRSHLINNCSKCNIALHHLTGLWIILDVTIIDHIHWIHGVPHLTLLQYSWKWNKNKIINLHTIGEQFSLFRLLLTSISWHGIPWKLFPLSGLNAIL